MLSFGCFLLLLRPTSPLAPQEGRQNETGRPESPGFLLPGEEGMPGVERERGFMGRSGHLWGQLSWEDVTQSGRTVWRPEEGPQVDASPPWLWALCPRGNALRYQCGSWMVKVSLVCALGLLVVVGNGAVIAVVASSVSGWSHTSRLVLLSLAAADAALALFVVPLNLYHSLALGPVAEEEEDKEDEEGSSYCHAVAFVNSSIFSTSLYSLAGVSLERYVAVFFPLRYGHLLSRRRVALLIAAAWLLPVLLLAPMAVPGPSAVLRVRFSAAALLCEPDYASNKAYSLLIAGTVFCPAAGLITFANLRLWLVARSQRRRRRKGTATFAGPKKLCSFQLDAAARVLLPVIIAFYLCWAPCISTILYNSFTRKRVHEWVEFVALWLPIGSGFLNCFVYFWVNRNFRRKLQKIRRTLCQPCHKSQPSKQWPYCLPTISAAVEGDGRSRGPSLFPGCPRIASSSRSLRGFRQDGSPPNL